MVERNIEVGDVQTVDVSADGDVTANGWDEDTLSLIADADESEDISVERDGDTLRLHVAGDARVQMPRRIGLRVSYAGGDVRASSFDQEVVVRESPGDLHVQDVRARVIVESVAGDAELRRIRGATSAQSVSGDLKIHGVEGDVSANSVGGDLHAQQISGSVNLPGPVAGDVLLGGLVGAANLASVAGDLTVTGSFSVRVESVGGDLRLEDVRDEVVAEHIGGDANLDDCRGPVTLGNVGGDLRARAIAGGLRAPSVGGDVRLRTAFAPGRDYVISCSGSATIALAGSPAAASVTFELHSGQDRIQVSLPLEDVTREPGVMRGRLGDGEAMVNVESGDRIRLASQEGESGFEGPMSAIFSGVEAGMREAFGFLEGGDSAQFDRRKRDLNERIARATEEIQRRTAERIEHQAQRMARRAEEAAQRAAERAAEHVARQTERAWTWRFGHHGPSSAWGRRPSSPPPPPPASPPPKPRATEEERLTVLRLLAEGKINADQAAHLLDALGG